MRAASSSSPEQKSDDDIGPDRHERCKAAMLEPREEIKSIQPKWTWDRYCTNHEDVSWIGPAVFEDPQFPSFWHALWQMALQHALVWAGYGKQNSEGAKLS